MNKTTIELERVKDHIQGYGYLFGPPYSTDSVSTLDKLVEWSNEPQNKGKKIVKHVVYAKDVPQKHLKYHYAPENPEMSQEDCAKLFASRLKDKGPRHRFENDNTIVHHGGMVYRMLYCDQIYYADIYWQ